MVIFIGRGIDSFPSFLPSFPLSGGGDGGVIFWWWCRFETFVG
jgi:hypothetical protein